MEPNKRNATQTKPICNECAQCGNMLIAPVWSEHLSERSIRHLWNCDTCDYKYETTVYLVPRARAQNFIDTAA
jgi:DNA-directed RNA polymerase subunit M/transcription elongation factor TFIIS